jgi:hypothetical protein
VEANIKDAGKPHSDIRTSLALALTATVIYLLFLSINYDSNGILIARGVESGDPVHANHMLFEITGSAVLYLARILGHDGAAFTMLQILAALCGGLTLGGTYLVARHIGADRGPALVAAGWLGTTWAFWNWSTNVAYIGMATMLAVGSLVLAWQAKKGFLLVLAGIVAALSVLAWQPNIFLLPSLLAAFNGPLASTEERIKQSSLLLVVFGLTLSASYAAVAGSVLIGNPLSVLERLTSYGGTQTLSWGRWGWERCGELARTWIHSALGWISLQPQWFFSPPVRFNTVFPRLAPWALAVFILVPLIKGLRPMREWRTLWCLLGLISYLPFAVWWDPFETKWLMVANVFVALLAARMWSCVSSRIGSFIAATAVLVLCVSNLSLYGIPGHTQLSANYQIGECVGRRLSPSDLYIATDWAWGDYMAYQSRRDSVDLMGTAGSFAFDKAKTLDALVEMVKQRQQTGADVYMTDPPYNSHNRLQVLQASTGITPSELDNFFPGRVAFSCQDWPIRRLDPVVRALGSWEQVAATTSLHVSATGGIYATDETGPATSIKAGSLSLRSEPDSAAQAVVLIERSSAPEPGMILSGRQSVRQGVLWLDNRAPERSSIVLLNPEPHPAEVSWYITDEFGRRAGAGTASLSAGSNLARYADEVPFSTALTARGLLHFSSTSGIVSASVIGRSTISSPLPGAAYIPYVEAGAGKIARIVLGNPSKAALTGLVQITDDSEGSDPLTQTIRYAVPGLGIWEYVMESAGKTKRTGWIQIVPREGGMPEAIVEIEESGRPHTVVPRAIDEKRLFLYTGMTPFPQAVRDRNLTSVRIINPWTQAGSAHLTLRVPGQLAARTMTVEIPGKKSFIFEVHDVPELSGLPAGLHTMLDIEIVGPTLIAAAVLPSGAVVEALPPAGESYIPWLVSGMGYRSTLLFSGALDATFSAQIPLLKWVPPQ